MCLPALATFTNCLKFEISLQESSNINSYFVPFLGRFSINSVSTPWINCRFSFAFVFEVFGNVFELFLKFLGKCLKYWEYRDVLYAHRPKNSISVPAAR